MKRARRSLLHHVKKHLLPFLGRNESFVDLADTLPYIDTRSGLDYFVRRLYQFLAHVNAHLNTKLGRIRREQLQKARLTQDALLYVMRRLNRIARRFLGHKDPLPISGAI